MGVSDSTLIAGWVVGKIMKGGGYGVLADILLGIVGGIVGRGSIWFRSGRHDLEHPGRDSRCGHPDLDHPAY